MYFSVVFIFLAAKLVKLDNKKKPWMSAIIVISCTIYTLLGLMLPSQVIRKQPLYNAKTDNKQKQNNRLIVVDNETNQGVGGALIAGYNYAIEHTKATAIGIVAGDDQFDST